jgi:predicted RNase H-like HicB family nuclease
MVLMREAIEMHLEGMLEDGEPIPQPTCTSEYMEVEIPQIAARKAS